MTGDALAALGSYLIAIEGYCSFGNRFSSRVKLEMSLRRRRRDWCRDCSFSSLVEFSLSLKVELFVSIFRLACLLPEFVSAPCDRHLPGICHCDLLRTKRDDQKRYFPTARSTKKVLGPEYEICGLHLRPKIPRGMELYQ